MTLILVLLITGLAVSEAGEPFTAIALPVSTFFHGTPRVFTM